MKKAHIFLLVLALAAAVSAAYYVSVPRDDGPAEETSTPTDPPFAGESEPQAYFSGHLIAGGVDRVGQPIEGFDAELLLRAYPGLIDADFEGVATLEGHYEVRGGELRWTRDDDFPATSAERMVTEEGYATLLANLSSRLGMSARTTSDIDLIIAAIE